MKLPSYIIPILLLGTSCAPPSSDATIPLTFTPKEFKEETCVGESCAEVEFSWPEAGGDIAALGINSAIQEKLLTYFYADSAAADLPGNSAAYLQSYRDFIEAYPDAPGGWAIEVGASVTYESDSTLSVFFTEYNYSGGAHPNSSQHFLNFNKYTGELLPINELVLDLGKMQELAEASFRDYHQVSEGVKLEDDGRFFIPETGFFLPNAMGYLEGKFTLIYVPYEIGPYVLGYTHLEFDPGELKGIVRR